MNASFPPHPSLEQLRKQAKDVLKLHRTGDGECCGVLRSLRQFAEAPEGEVLAADVALNDVQFALAMHYGYDSWADLKRHVDFQQADAAMPRLERGSDAVCIRGLEHMDYGGSFFRRQDSFMTTFAAVLRAAGEDVTFEQVAGVSGGAFRLHVAQPDWCPSAACTGPGFNCGELALDAFGYSAETISLDADENPDGPEQARKAVVASIDAGLPAMYMDGECSLAVGYRDAGRVFLCKPYAGGEAYVEKEAMEGMFGAAWFVQVFNDRGERPEWRESVVKSLETAVMLARTPAFDNYASGFGAYEAWIGDLESPKDNPNLHANAYNYATLLTNRAAAAEYLGDLSAHFAAEAFAHLRTAADRYAAVSGRLLAGRGCVAIPWKESWTPENRAAEAEIMRENLADERVAVAEIEQALAATGEE